MRRTCIYILTVSLTLSLCAGIISAGGKKPANSKPDQKPSLPDPIIDEYRGYEPDFIKKIKEGSRWRGPFYKWVRKKDVMRTGHYICKSDNK